MKIRSINPYTEVVNWSYNLHSIRECKAHLEKSRAALSKFVGARTFPDSSVVFAAMKT